MLGIRSLRRRGALLALVFGLLLPAAAAAQSTGNLIIEKVAPQGTTDTFNFTVDPGGVPVAIQGNGQSAPIALAQGTYSIREIVPSTWILSDVECRLFRELTTGEWTPGSDTITGVTVQSEATTLCTFFDDPKPLRLSKTNDANGDGVFSDDETVPANATFPRVVTYQAVITNGAQQGSASIQSLTDDQVPPPLDTAGDGIDCSSVIGTTIAAGSSVTCFYDATFAATGPSEVTNTLTVQGLIGSEQDDSATDTSVVRFRSNLTIDKTADAETVAAGSPVGFNIIVGNTGRASTGVVTLTDPLPARPGLSWSVSPAIEGCSISEQQALTCNLSVIGGGQTRTVHVTSPTTRDSCGTLDNTATAVATSDEVSVSDAATTTVACAGVTLDKLGPAEVRHGDPLNYTFEVANAGGDGLTSPVVTDDHCTVGANTTARRNDDGDEQLETPGVDGAASEIWVYACTGTVPAHTDGEPNPIHNVANVTASASLERSLTATDSHDTRIVHAAAVVPGATAHPAVHITNDAPDKADAGDRITYRLTVTNPGDVPLVGEAVAVTDDDCDAPPVLLTRGEDTTPGTLDPGDTWIYTCTTRVAKDAGARRAPRQARLRIDNLATVTATAATGALVSDADGVSTFVSRGNVAPSQTTPSGTARLRGPSGCVRDAFVARVSGRSIRRVTVKVDGRVVKRFKKAANRYRYRVRPGRFGDGLHRLSARVAFLSGSGTRPRTLRMVFERCQRPVIVPPFTG